MGRADVVELHGDQPVPVEYKSGGPEHARHAALQLCAQGLCLEEMLGVAVPVGFLFFAQTKEKVEVFGIATGTDFEKPLIV
jgi:CRISPR-associated exonuclease Cas4